MSYFVYKDADKSTIDLFTKSGFKVVTSIGDVKNSTIVYDMSYPVECGENNGNTLILLVTNPIFDTKIIDKFDFFLPTSPYLYDNLLKTLGFRLLLPINPGGHKYWDKYFCTDKFFRGYRSRLSTFKKGNYNACGLVIYDDNNELVGKDYSNVRTIKIDSCINKTLFDIHNHLVLRRKAEANTKFYVPKQNGYETIFVKNYSDKINVKRGVRYFIVREGFRYTQGINFAKIFDNCIRSNLNIASFKVSGATDPEYALIWHNKRTKSLTLCEMLTYVEYHDSRIVGHNETKITDDDVYNIYYHYGQRRMYHMYEHLLPVQNSYYDVLVKFVRKINIVDDQRCNGKKFLRIVSFWGGLNNYPFKVSDITDFVKNNEYLFEQKRALLVSKAITSYGGNQKTAIQVYNELMEEGYDVKVACITKIDLVGCIDKNDVLKFKRIDDMVMECNSGPYEFVIINKLDEMVGRAKHIKPRRMFITHNSMDPVNTNLIKYNGYFEKIFTINHHHASSMYSNGVNCTVTRYLNYDDNNIKRVDDRKTFRYNIVFIGRLSNEKNLSLLLDSLAEFNKGRMKNKIKLTVMGNGKIGEDVARYANDPNVYFTGRVDHDRIIYYLSNADYLVSTSCTEGIPFVFLEAMSAGIPVISSNIIGCKEVVNDNSTGFLYDFEGYNEIKDSMSIVDGRWNVFNIMSRHRDKNVKSIVSALERAYSVSISQWNTMSQNCHSYYTEHFNIGTKYKINMRNMNSCNKVAIVCDDCDPMFERLFKNIDIVKSLDESVRGTYDMVLDLNTFDIFCGRLSLLKNNRFDAKHLGRMNKTMSRLYRLRREMIDNDIRELLDGKSRITINKGEKSLNVNAVNNYI